MRVTLRLFAAAREAVGAPERTVEIPDTGTIADALTALDPDDAAADVLGRCSVLVDGEAQPDRSAVLRDGVALDVLPPFAGG